MDYLEALRYLFSLADFERTGRITQRTDLASVLALLEELDNPHLGPLTVHIAGSKGKGSVAAMIESVLRTAGLRTGLFTSPHLCRFSERIQIDGKAVTTDAFAAGLDTVRQAAERVEERLPDRQLVTFDVLTALGFYLFRQHDVAAQVIEVGLGGLLDSTNVFAEKAAAVITNIGLEHTDVLGETIPEIAAQKAGIIVSHSPTVMAPQRESAAEVIRDVAQAKESPLTEVALACNLRRDAFSAESQTFHLRTPSGGYQAKLPLLGKHQLDNAATAICALEALASAGVKIPDTAVKAGLEKVSWPARIEAVKRRPLVIIDAAHTADSARRLRDTLSEYFHLSQATLIIGLMDGKDLDAIASAVEPVARRVIATRADHPRALAPEPIMRAFQDRGVEVWSEREVPNAVAAALNLSTPSDAIVILGSVALAGEARAHILGLEKDPPVHVQQRVK